MTMGHSRGGKTALWHGAQDERVAIAYPLMSGCSGNGAIRVTTPHTPAGDGDAQSVLDINRGFPYCTFDQLAATISRTDVCSLGSQTLALTAAAPILSVSMCLT